jgi:hypothetical protein
MAHRTRTTLALMTIAAALTILPGGPAVPQDQSFDDPLFRRCVDWMMKGYGGALIDNRCLDEYGLPPPSLFICARKISRGFSSQNDLETCAVIFDEQARKVRSGYILK